MTNIGKLRSANPADPLHELIGQIRTVGFVGKITITRESQSDNPRAPSHNVYIIDDAVGRINVGAAWLQRIKQGNREGEEFLSVTIDAPSFAQPLSFAVFQEDEDLWIATWRRRQSTQ